MTARVATLRDVPAILDELARARMVAIDTEFHAERTWLPELFLVQLVVPGQSPWIVDPLIPGLLQALAPGLLGGVTWLVHAGEQDLRVLYPALGGVADIVLDTQIAAALVDDVHPAGLGRLVETWLGRRIAKTATLSDWSRRPLDPEQLAYAAEDVALLPALWDRLATRAGALGREGLVQQACAEAKARALAPPEARELWRELVSHPVDGEEAAVLQALAVWREQLAVQENRPARSLISDAALRQLAKTRPLTIQRIEDQRRLPRAFVRNHSAALMSAVAAASARPHTWPLVATPGTSHARRSNALRIFADVWGHQYRFSGSFVLPVAVRDAVTATLAPDPALLMSLLSGWRNALLGDLLWESLNGTQAIAILNGEPQIASLGSDAVSGGSPSADPPTPPSPVV